MLGPAKRRIRARYGWLPPSEVRNKLTLFPSYPGLIRFERAEARRLLATLGGVRPRARVAVVLPTYRRPDGLRAALDSVLAQTLSDLVVAVVDDGGGLPSGISDDPRVFLLPLSRNIRVVGVVRNIGIRLTESAFVAFLDDDNTWEPNHLAVALQRLTDPAPATRPDAVYTALRRITPDGRLHDVLSVPYDRRRAREESFLDPNNFVARRVPALQFSRLRRNAEVAPREDWEMIYRFGRRHRVEHIPVPTVNYLVNPDSYWTSWDAAALPPGEPAAQG
jgi:glycosyltransferase involved in cell wall biosynthesis